MDFEYPEDKKYFVDVLADGNEEEFDVKFRQLFDFRDPQIKRKEFNRNYQDLKQELSCLQSKCGLRLSKNCTGSEELEIDHIIPLSSNKLNKELRNIKAMPGRKVEAQSFGSNHIDNLILACHNCNAKKKHKILDKITMCKVLNEKYQTIKNK